MPDFIRIFENSVGQPLEGQIKLDGRAYDLTGDTVKFRMRVATEDDTTLVVDANATIDNATKGEVSYTWTTNDVDTPGEYYGWWHIITSGGVFDSPEFLIVIDEHAPGIRTRTGNIYSRARAIIPTTWSALEEWDKYGDANLQRQIEVIKKRVFGVDVSVDNEANYDIRIQQYVAKLAAIAVIPTGVDYWLNQHQSVSATGTNENTSFPDRIKALWEIQKRLVAEVATERGEIEDLLDLPAVTPSTSTPEFSPGTKEGFKTPLPSEFFDYTFSDSKTIW